MNPLTTTMLGYYRPEYDSFTLSTLMNSYTTAWYCCGNSILRDTLRVLHRQEEGKIYQAHIEKLSQIILSQISQNFIISKDSPRDQIANNCKMARHKFRHNSD